MKKKVSATVVLSAACAALAAPTGTEWKEPENLSFGREERRAAFSSFDSLESALKILPEYSERTITLDSDTAWKFKWSKDPASRPVGFYKPSFDVSGWETIKVPCSWQAYGANGKGGWGTAIYVNQTYPFKRDQPDVMGEPAKDWTSYLARNPIGSYRRDFDVPAKWSGQDLFLKFDAVDSFFYLWVNGKYVGFSKDSRSPAEFNVTGFVKPGKNTVAVEVYRYSDGSYLEDQDMFRLSGIARSVWLLARPKARIRDFYVTPRPVDKADLKGDWELAVNVAVTRDACPYRDGAATGVAVTRDACPYRDGAAAVSSKPPYRVGLYTMDGKPVGMKRVPGKSCVYRVASPKLWSAEEPNCYKIVIDNGAEYVSAIVGFFVSEIRDGRYWFNNEKIKLRGVNRHETDPMYGHWVPRAVHELDIRLMKEANINHIRNAHYPQDDYFYYLCNIHGIYVMDEANVESHGYYYGKDSLSHRPEWQKATVARNIDMVRRNRNHPCVTMWSLGNEAGPGANFRAAAAAIKAIDTTRPLQYERDNSLVDMDSNQYPGVGWVQWKAAHHQATKPFYISEYAHNMCNAMGNLKDYQIAIESSDVILGAAIWDWVDQGLWMKKDGKMIFAYGGDFGDKPNSGQFVFNGVVLSDRTLEPGYFEVKHVFQPFDFTFGADGRTVTVRNLNYFRSGKGLSLVEKGVDGFKVPLTVAPRGEQTVTLPASDVCARTVQVVLDGAEGFLPAGHVVADAQYVDKTAFEKTETFSVAGTVASSVEKDRIVFTAGGVTVAFCRASGALVSYVTDGVETLLAPMTLDAYRAPSSNEVGLGGRWLALGLREFVQKAESVSDVTTNADGSKSVTIIADVRGKWKERLIGYGGNDGKPCAIVPVGPTAAFDPHFVVAQKWTVFANGTVACQSEIRPRGRVVELARIGYRFTLDKRFASADWFGAGPFENYPDRKSGAFLGAWSSAVADFVINYGKPQDMGNMEDAYYVGLREAADGGRRFSVVTLGEPFSFSALPYSPTELTLAMHLQALGPAEKTELGIFAAVRGLGGASCGPGPIERDIIRSNKPFTLGFLINPSELQLKKLPKLPDPALPPDVRTGEDIMPVVVACSSAEPGEGNAEHLVDGDLGTIWHSQYGVTLTKYPHTVSVGLGRTVEATGVSVWQRENGTNGNVKDFTFEVSEDGKTWRKVLATALKGGAGEQKFAFKTPCKVKFWRFTGLNEHGGREFASLAEVTIEEKK